VSVEREAEQISATVLQKHKNYMMDKVKNVKTTLAEPSYKI
jgi:hypothetical protein